MNTRKPTLKELENYTKWLTLTIFLEKLEAVIGEPVTSFSMDGEWHSNDEGGSNVSVSSITCNKVIEVEADDEWREPEDIQTDEEWMEFRAEGTRRVQLSDDDLYPLTSLGETLINEFDLDVWTNKGGLEEPMQMRVIENE